MASMAIRHSNTDPILTQGGSADCEVCVRQACMHCYSRYRAVIFKHRVRDCNIHVGVYEQRATTSSLHKTASAHNYWCGHLHRNGHKHVQAMCMDVYIRTPTQMSLDQCMGIHMQMRHVTDKVRRPVCRYAHTQMKDRVHRPD